MIRGEKTNFFFTNVCRVKFSEIRNFVEECREDKIETRNWTEIKEEKNGNVILGYVIKFFFIF